MEEARTERHKNQESENSYVVIKELMRDVFENIEKRCEGTPATGVATGFQDLDRITGGLQPSELIIIAGPPSTGKTALALNIAEYATIYAEGKVPALFFSLELGKEMVAERLLCSISRVNVGRLRTGYLAEADWPRLTMGAGCLSESSLFIDDTSAISVFEMCSRARRLRAEYGLGLIVIDYLQLVKDNAGNQQNLLETSRTLKALAKELGVPVIALSQMEHSVESRTDRRPILPDLRESIAIKQYADTIMFVYRDVIYCEACINKSFPCEKKHENDAEIIIAKQNKGPTGTVLLAFQDQFIRFDNHPACVNRS